MRYRLFFFFILTGFHSLISVTGFSQTDSSIKNFKLRPLPVIVRSIETGWSFGVLFSATFHIKAKDTNVRTSNLQALALYSLQHQFVTAINGTAYFPGEKYIASFQISYSDFPDKFWGIGKQAKETDKEPYAFKQYYIFLHAQRQSTNNFFIGLLYEYQRLISVDYTAGGIFDKQQVVGRNGYHVSGAGLSFTYDTRNHAFVPDKGVFIQFLFNHFDNYISSQYRYTNYVIDIRNFFKLYKEQVLAVQLYGFFNAGEVPLRSLASFGGANSMRGYFDGRYRDKNQIVFQGEYRLPIKGRMGAVAFANFGDVGSGLSDFSLKDLKYSCGAGIRFALDKKEKLNLRLDYGAGQGSNHGFYFQLGEAF